MVLMLFTDLNTEDKNILLKTAKESIVYGLKHHSALPVRLNDFSSIMQTSGATFVTLNKLGQLRGCIGALEAHQALIKDVSEHAFAAAFEDPRFPAVCEDEIEQLDISISILTPSTVIHFKSEKDLLTQLRPGVDGLILRAGFHQATFLPAVWEQLKKPEDFLNHLKVKAGLNANDWPEEIVISRYESIHIK